MTPDGPKHSRAGSESMGVLIERSCSCGLVWKGSSEATFIERDAHIDVANGAAEANTDQMTFGLAGVGPKQYRMEI